MCGNFPKESGMNEQQAYISGRSNILQIPMTQETLNSIKYINIANLGLILDFNTQRADPGCMPFCPF